jgi:hypothetical protein
VVKTSLSYRRAIAFFLLGYAVINVLATITTLLVAVVLNVSLSGQTVNIHNHAVAVAERYYPLLNLLVWVTCAWLYFRRIDTISTTLAWQLGGLWLVLGAVVNEIAFVLIPSPYSFSAHDWYIGQFPWIYLTYGAVAISPLVAMVIMNRWPHP